MMKILFLNPHLDTEKNIGAALAKYGISVAYCCDPIQALEVLKVHGNSLDLALVHREDANGEGEPGIGFIASLKEDKIQNDLPIILTTDQWSPEQ
jgi:DNA-binding response OmpR family regulator